MGDGRATFHLDPPPHEARRKPAHQLMLADSADLHFPVTFEQTSIAKEELEIRAAIGRAEVPRDGFESSDKVASTRVRQNREMPPLCVGDRYLLKQPVRQRAAILKSEMHRREEWIPIFIKTRRKLQRRNKNNRVDRA